MPLLWRYLIKDYLKVVVLATVSFIAVLLTTRFDEIAHFACLGSSWIELLQFIILQLPYLLPIALPISALIASAILFIRLSQKQELTAMRASGLSLPNLLAPILITAALLTLVDFYLVSEIASSAHLANGQMRHRLRTINPLLLLQNKRLLQMQGVFCETLGVSRHGEYASNVLFVLPDREHQRMVLMVGDTIHGKENTVHGENITIISSQPKDGFDSVTVENIASLETPYEAFAPALQQKTWTIHPDHFKMPLLLAHIETQKIALADACQDPSADAAKCKDIKKALQKGYSEISRRLSLALTFFSFTCVGAAFGMQIGRQQHSRRILWMGLLAAAALLCYFLAKSYEDRVVTASIYYFAPQACLLIISGWMVHRINRGIE